MKRFALNSLALLLVLAFVGLGRWQLDREAQKREQLAAADAALAAAPMPLGKALLEYGRDEADGEPTTVRRVAGEVVFVGPPQVWLDNQRRGERVGVHLYCAALVPPTGGGAILVDLGWLPLAGDRRLPEATCPRGAQDLAGLLAPPPAIGVPLGPGVVEQDDGSLLATRLEIPLLAGKLSPSLFRSPPATTDLVPLLSHAVLRLDPAVPLGYERDLELLANTLPPEKHRAYALQWFGLAATLAVIALVMNFRRKPAP